MFLYITPKTDTHAMALSKRLFQVGTELVVPPEPPILELMVTRTNVTYSTDLTILVTSYDLYSRHQM